MKMLLGPTGFSFKPPLRYPWEKFPISHSDIRVSLDFILHTGDGVGIVVRDDGTRANHYYARTFSTSVIIAKHVAGQPTTLSSTKVSIEKGKEYNLTLDACGDTLRLYLNGEFMCEAKDTQYTEGSLFAIVAWIPPDDGAVDADGIVTAWEIMEVPEAPSIWPVVSSVVGVMVGIVLVAAVMSMVVKK